MLEVKILEKDSETLEILAAVIDVSGEEFEVTILPSSAHINNRKKEVRPAYHQIFEDYDVGDLVAIKGGNLRGFLRGGAANKGKSPLVAEIDFETMFDPVRLRRMREINACRVRNSNGDRPQLGANVEGAIEQYELDNPPPTENRDWYNPFKELIEDDLEGGREMLAVEISVANGTRPDLIKGIAYGRSAFKGKDLGSPNQSSQEGGIQMLAEERRMAEGDADELKELDEGVAYGRLVSQGIKPPKLDKSHQYSIDSLTIEQRIERNKDAFKVEFSIPDYATESVEPVNGRSSPKQDLVNLLPIQKRPEPVGIFLTPILPPIRPYVNQRPL